MKSKWHRFLPSPVVGRFEPPENGARLTFERNSGMSQAHISQSGEQDGADCLPINKQGDPVLFEKDAGKVSSLLDLTSAGTFSPSRVDIGGGIDTTILVVPMALLVWFGLALPFVCLTDFLIFLFTNEDICDGGKSGAAGAYFDGGLAAENGPQTQSARTSTGNHIMPWYRNLQMMKSIMRVWLPIETALYLFVELYFPDLLLFGKPGNQIPSMLKRAAASLGFKKQSPFPFVQRAFRLAGMPDHNQHKWHRGIMRKWLEDKVKEGLAGLHTDSTDTKGRSLMVYFCFPGWKHLRSSCGRLLAENDVVLFPNKNGGRGVRVTTMLPWRIVIIIHHSQNVHCNVHPNAFSHISPNYQPSNHGTYGIRIMLYTPAKVNTMIESIGELEDDARSIIKTWRDTIDKTTVQDGMTEAYLDFVNVLQSREVFYKVTGVVCPDKISYP